MTTTTLTLALDAAAFAQLWRELRDELRGYLYRRCPWAADEVLSETFARAWAKRHTFRPEAGTPRSWLFQVARNVLTDHLRYEGCRPLVFVNAYTGEAAADHTDHAARTVERLTVWAALAGLPDHYRRVLTLRFLLDLDVPAVAALLGVPAGTVKSMTYRAARALSIALAEPGQPITRRAGL